MVALLQVQTLPQGALAPRKILRPKGLLSVKSLLTTSIPIKRITNPVTEPRDGAEPEIEASVESTTTTTTTSTTTARTTTPDRDTPAWQWVSTTEQVEGLVRSLEGLPTSPPSLFIDLEGVNLGRNGTVSILQMYVLPHDRTYLIDVHTLGQKAFTHDETENNAHAEHTTTTTTTLKAILESATIKKVIFDVRHDSDALYAHYGINLGGIEDLQLMELANRGGERTRVKGLSYCIRYNIPYAAWKNGQDSIDQWVETKEKGRKLFAPEHGGSLEVFNDRPLSMDVLMYCIEDVRMLPILWKVYDGWLTPLWRKLVDKEVQNRIRYSQSAKFKSGPHMTLAPAGWDDVQDEEEEELYATEPDLVAEDSEEVGQGESDDSDGWGSASPYGYQQMDYAAGAQVCWPADGYQYYDDYNAAAEYQHYALPDGYRWPTGLQQLQRRCRVPTLRDA
ncbi:ribonuclease H-like domain-containing protein [Aspergillus carlsbadensis]|nr:ribonuclease H-like domain-containing protein [Aspergillus carlsbadensis]